MRTIFILLPFLLTLTTTGQSLKTYFKEKDSDLKYEQTFKSKDNPSIVAVISVFETDWWETLSIVRLKNDTVLWEATFDSYLVNNPFVLLNR